jgi:hypothetical protein
MVARTRWRLHHAMRTAAMSEAMFVTRRCSAARPLPLRVRPVHARPHRVAYATSRLSFVDRICYANEQDSTRLVPDRLTLIDSILTPDPTRPIPDPSRSTHLIFHFLFTSLLPFR